MQAHSPTGFLFALVTVLIWGAQLPIAKTAFVGGVDGYTLSLVRFGGATIGLLPLLAWREGRGALSGDGQGRLAAFAGVACMGASAVLVFVGLGLTRPETAVTIVALQPAMTAIGEWVTKGRRPAAFTIGCLLVAFGGVVTVVTRGGAALRELAGASGTELLGDALVFAGAVAWVAYALLLERFRGWSSLRVSALTCAWAAAGILATWAAALVLGAATVPTGEVLAAQGWRLAYCSVVGVLVAMFLWNAGIRRIGALNAMLVLSLMPVVTFGFRALEGARFEAVELAGAALVVGALVANNVFMRLRAVAPPAALAEHPEA